MLPTRWRLACIVAPSAGKVHRFPLDCWRFYPDSWAALCGYVGLELLETYREEPDWRIVAPGAGWGDAMMVARKPELADEVTRKAFYDRLDAIVATRTTTLQPQRRRADPCRPPLPGGAHMKTPPSSSTTLGTPAA